MWHRVLWLLILLTLAGALGAREFDAAATQAGVASADGKVEKQVAGGPWRGCSVGDVLVTGDRIRTGSESTASLLFTDKTIMRLGAGTTITLIDLTESDGRLVRKFEQQGGRTWSDVTPNPAKATTYEVRGPNAVAAVKGTSFEVDAETGETDVLCWEGEVQCQADGAATFQPLPANQRFQARRGKLPEILKFNPEQARDAFQHWNLNNRARQQAWLNKLPPRIKLEAATLRTLAQRYHVKLSGDQRQKLKQMLQQHPPKNPRPGRRPR